MMPMVNEYRLHLIYFSDPSTIIFFIVNANLTKLKYLKQINNASFSTLLYFSYRLIIN